MSLILTPVSFGEVLDKITILEIKSVQIKDPIKQKNVTNELIKLLDTWNQKVPASAEINQLKSQLKQVNQRLWDIEDRIRVKELNKEFDDEFIKVARSVYYENDERAAIKKEVNLLLGSELIEEKSYENYQS
jgi:hypothetical protein